MAMKEFKLYIRHDTKYHDLLAKYPSHWPTLPSIDSQYHYHIDFKHEVREWLDSVAKDGWTHYINIAWNIRSKVPYSPYMVDMVLGFHDPGIAALFKLRWM